MRILTSIILILSSIGLLIGQESFQEKIKLNEIIIEFEQSIIEKDSVRFQKLFFHNKVPFVGKMTPKTEMSIKKDYPDFEGLTVSSSDKFIREICQSEKNQKETFYNIKIDSDGAIATINFDYSFYTENKMMQWGNENWNLVFTENQWLITDVIFSIRFPDIEDFPYAAKK